MSTMDVLPVSMGECLSHFATAQPESTALIIVDSQGDTRYSYAELAQRSRALAACLQQWQVDEPVVGERALLMLDSGVDYVVAFFACLYAGVVAVPIFPPESVHAQQLQRLRIVAENADARWILTSSDVAGTLSKSNSMQSISFDAELVLVNQIDVEQVAQYQPWTASDDDLAFLQYTSGSTSDPKGVMVSHGNLMANEAALKQAAAVNDQDIFVSWLPLFHDMGLIFGLLLPFYCGRPVVLMSPRFFLERPSRWLETIDRHSATISGGPDFSYRLCVERIRDSQLKQWDLSSWRLAFSGAEPIRADTLNDFVAHMDACQFNPQAILASYGLAEATLLVSSTKPSSGLLAVPFVTEALAQGVARKATKKKQSSSMQVACGKIPQGHELLIVDPTSLEIKKTGLVGEIWVSGPSITQGYWNNSQATANAFVEKKAQRWLRTGDLGFIYNRQLYISGRCKDLIIIRGQNFYPQDIEMALESELDWLRRGRVAAFAANLDSHEGIGLALEVSRSIRGLATPQTLVEQLNEVVSCLCMESVSVALLLESGALPKTSSGKLQRSACHLGWQQHSLDAYAIYEAGHFVKTPDARSTQDKPAPNKPQDTSGFEALPFAAPQGEIEEALAKIWCEVLKLKRVGRSDNFFALGGHSLLAAQLMSRVRLVLGFDLPLRKVFEHPVLQSLSGYILTAFADDEQKSDEPVLQPVSRIDTIQLSPVQRRLWLVDRLADVASSNDRAAYNISAALRFVGVLDPCVLGATVNAIVSRHEVLRTAYPEDDGGDTMAVISPEVSIEVPLTDISMYSTDEQRERVELALSAHAGRVFDLATGPLLRAMVLRLGERHHVLLLSVHHIVFDGWSEAVFVKEFVAIYQALMERTTPRLPHLRIQYADYADWHARKLSRTLKTEADFWRGYLDAAPQVSTLLADYTRPVVTSTAGDVVSMELPQALVDDLARLAREQETTLFTLLLATFLLLLHQQANAEDFVIGTDVAGRNHPDLEGLIGFFVNVIPLRSRFARDATFLQWLSRVKDSTLSAFEHQEVPFDQIVEYTGMPRDRHRNPLVQVLFVLQNVPESCFEIPGVEIEVIPRSVTQSKFDLAMFVNETPQGLQAQWVYATSLYRRETVERASTAWRDLLQQVVAIPGALLEHFAIPDIKESMVTPVPKVSKLDKLKKIARKKGVPNAAPCSPVRTSFLADRQEFPQKFPMLIEATSRDVDVVAWAREQRDFIETTLQQHAGILFRNFGIKTPQAFEAFAEAIEPQLYGSYGDLPRKEGGRNIYRSTPYPERQMILYHNESSHLDCWPRKQWFFCELPAPVGGTTPIVDCREMLRRLPLDLVDTLERKQLLYVRTFTDRLDVSWQDFFRTDSQAEVEARLIQSGTEWRWLDSDELQTRTRCPAVITHPVTGDRVFFNQMQLHHVSCLEPEVRDALLAKVGLERMPRHIYYGDGTSIEDATMELIGRVYETCAVRFDWQQGDVVMLDNMLAAHARDPFEGNRKIVVAMGEMFERAALGSSIPVREKTVGRVATNLRTEGVT